MVSVVIVCGGKSTRFHGSVNKILLPLGGKPIFMHSVDKFLKFSDDVIVVANINDLVNVKQHYTNVVLGGKTRQASVLAGVKQARYDKVIIHDGARPFVSEEEILALINTDSDCAFVGIDVVNSLKIKNG